ncbi:MAG TPA: ABC transporter permease, partial [Cellulomonadaceae bacterium]|nr:ABC transporter permease [Cellulomonadaceae bacterium]
MPRDTTVLVPDRASVAPSPGRPAGRDTRSARRVGAVLLGPVALLAVWQLVVGFAPDASVVSPSDVVRAAVAAWARGDLPSALTTSLGRGVVGFVLAVAIGTPLAIAVARVHWVRIAFGPLLKGLLVLPS